MNLLDEDLSDTDLYLLDTDIDSFPVNNFLISKTGLEDVSKLDFLKTF